MDWPLCVCSLRLLALLSQAVEYLGCAIQVFGFIDVQFVDGFYSLVNR